jgi:hypothetical protein
MDEQDMQDKNPVLNPVNPVHPCQRSAARKAAPALDLRHILRINCEDLTGKIQKIAFSLPQRRRGAEKSMSYNNLPLLSG